MAEYQNTREIALEIIIQVMEQDKPSHLIIRQALDKYDWLEREKKAFISKLSMGTIERCIEMDAVLDSYSSVPVRKMKPFIRCLLRMSVYQILYMDRVPDSAACNEAVRMAAAHSFGRLKGFVNGVLRTIVREKNNDTIKYTSEYSGIAVRYSTPDWIIDMCREAYGEPAALQMLEYMTDSAGNASGVTFRCLASVRPPEESRRLLEEDGVAAEWDADIPNVLHAAGALDSIGALRAVSDGSVLVQDKSSMLCALAVAPERGSTVIDACAAPGGKSIFLADFMEGSGTVCSFDVSEQKCAQLSENVRRTGLGNIRISVKDALVYDAALEGAADYVLADLPCSGLGILGKKGDIKYKMTPQRQEALVALQRRMLSVLARYVKPGGVLVYSTCTIHPSENTGNAEWFLERHPAFAPESLVPYLPERYHCESARRGYLQLLPGIDGTDGFFFARFRKEAGTHGA